jgi:TPR repeat protein
MYSMGDGVPKDDANAEAWYLKAAQQGDAMAKAHFHLEKMLNEAASEGDKAVASQDHEPRRVDYS